MKLLKINNKTILVDCLIKDAQNIGAPLPTPDATLVPTTPSYSWEILQPNTTLI